MSLLGKLISDGFLGTCPGGASNCMTSSKVVCYHLHPVCAELKACCVQVLSPKHAAAFANGMDYFNTYGGCTAAGAAGSAVLRVLQEQQMQQHAHRVGQYLTSKLEALKQVCAAPVLWLDNPAVKAAIPSQRHVNFLLAKL